MMNTLIATFLMKILRSANSATLKKNPATQLGKNLRIGSFCNFTLHPKAKEIILGNSLSVRHYCNFYVGENAELKIGDQVFMNNYCSVNCLDRIEIGENTLFGEGVKLYDHNHQYSAEKVEHQKFNTAPIKIGKNCWLGSNVTVLKGVTIGDHVIIGAGCVIHKNVPAHSVIMNTQEHLIKSTAE